MKNTIKTILLKAVSTMTIVILMVIGIQKTISAIDMIVYFDHAYERGNAVWFYERERVEYDASEKCEIDTDHFYALMYDDINLISVGIFMPSICMFIVGGLQIGWEYCWFAKRLKTLKKPD